MRKNARNPCRNIVAIFLAVALAISSVPLIPAQSDAFCDIRCLLGKFGMLRLDKLPDIGMMVETLLETYVIQPFLHRVNQTLGASLAEIDTSLPKMEEETIETVKANLPEKVEVKEDYMETYAPDESIAEQAYEAIITESKMEYDVPKNILPETVKVASVMTTIGHDSDNLRDSRRYEFVGETRMDVLSEIGKIQVAVNMQTDKEAKRGGVVDLVKNDKTKSSASMLREFASISGIEDEASSYVPTQVQSHNSDGKAYRAWCDYSVKKMEMLAKRNAHLILIFDLMKQKLRMTERIAITGTERYVVALQTNSGKYNDVYRKAVERISNPATLHH